MVDLLTFFLFSLLVLDYGNTTSLRRLVYSFLLSKRNVKGAQKIHNSQPRKDKLTLSYIGKYAIYKREFTFYHRLWIINLVSMLPQYLLIVIILIISPSVALCLIGGFVFVKIIMMFIIRSQFPRTPQISKFDKRYYEKKK